MNTSTRSTIAALALAGAAFGLTGCGSETPAPTPTTVTAAPAQSQPAPPPAPEAAAPAMLTYGQSVTWPKDVTITVSAPETFTPGEGDSSAYPDGVRYRYDVTITNGSDAPFFMGDVFFDTTIGEGAAGYYAGDGYGDYQPTDLLPGKTFVRTAAVSAPAAGEVIVHAWATEGEVTYDAYWTGDVSGSASPGAAELVLPEPEPVAVERPKTSGEVQAEWMNSPQGEAAAVQAAEADAESKRLDAEIAQARAESDAELDRMNAEAEADYEAAMADSHDTDEVADRTVPIEEVPTVEETEEGLNR